ncbi:unnamed protein product [Ectocarpus sp. 6 AP-2014]
MDDVVYLQGQRRPGVVTVPLASYPTFSDLKEHCRELFFKNSIDESFVVATCDRKVSSPMMSTVRWFRASTPAAKNNSTARFWCWTTSMHGK